MAETNCNTVLKEMGISVNDDSVMRQVYYKYLHPKRSLSRRVCLCQPGAQEEQYQLEHAQKRHK